MDLSVDTLSLGVGWYLVFIISTTLHEAAHAWTAWKLGDPTAYHAGQVTLNPLPHIEREPIGTILVPIASFLFGGWMIGWASAPYDPWWARNNPRRAALMAAAGPAANLLLMLLAALAIRIGIAFDFFYQPDEANFSRVTMGEPGVATGLATLLSIFFMLNLLLMIFNLLPLPPLDGSAILPLVMDRDTAARYQETMMQPMWSMLGILVAWRIFDHIFGPIHKLALSLLYPGTTWF